jgi:hypothetical protein
MADQIEAQHHAMMNALAAGIDDILNGADTPRKDRKLGFILLVAEFGKMDGGRVNYISNGSREDMLTMLREYLARVEGRHAEPASGVAQ